MILGMARRDLMRNTPKAIIDRTKAFSIKVVDVGLEFDRRRRMPSAFIETKGSAGDRSKGEQFTQRVRLIGDDHYWVSCSCPNFRYVWEYALAQEGASDIIYGNGEAPSQKNPRLVKGVCKHLYLVISDTEIVKGLRERLADAEPLVGVGASKKFSALEIMGLVLNPLDFREIDKGMLFEQGHDTDRTILVYEDALRRRYSVDDAIFYLNEFHDHADRSRPWQKLVNSVGGAEPPAYLAEYGLGSAEIVIRED